MVASPTKMNILLIGVRSVSTEALNCYFHSQYCANESKTDLPSLLVDDESPEIPADGVRKLIHALKNNKSLRPDQIRKCDLPVDSDITSKCLSLIDQKSLSNGVPPYQWKTETLHRFTRRARKRNHQTIGLSRSQAFRVKFLSTLCCTI